MEAIGSVLERVVARAATRVRAATEAARQRCFSSPSEKTPGQRGGNALAGEVSERRRNMALPSSAWGGQPAEITRSAIGMGNAPEAQRPRSDAADVPMIRSGTDEVKRFIAPHQKQTDDPDRRR